MTGRPVPRRKRPEEIADYRAWAQMTRAVLGWTDITEDDPIVRTPFRTAAKLPPRTASQLRAMAREQAAEATVIITGQQIGKVEGRGWLHAACIIRRQPMIGPATGT